MSRQRNLNTCDDNQRRSLLHQNQQQVVVGNTNINANKERRSSKSEKTPLLTNSVNTNESLANRSFVASNDIRTGVSWSVAAFLLVNTALGAGMLNYPFAYNQVGGVLVASLMQVILLVFITSTMFILVYCADFNKDDTYHDVLLSMCGKRAQQISALSILLTCFGINITFLVIIGDQYDRIFNSLLTPEFIEASWFLDRKFTIFITASLFIWPMCYAQRLDFLRHASILGMFAMLYVAFLTVYEHYKLDDDTIKRVTQMHQQQQQHGQQQSNTTSANNDDSIMKSVDVSLLGQNKHLQWFEPLAIVPVLCFAYQTHEVIVPVYACMRDRAIASFMKASIFGLVILFFLYNLVGAFGYLTFGENVGADIMSYYDASDPIVVVGIVALVVKFITTYPPLMFCGRSALDGLYGEIRKLSPSELKSSEPKRRYVITTIWFLTTVALAVFAPDISVTLQLLGSMASVNVFVFPGMCLVSLTMRLRRARQALLLGELPDGLASQQRAKDYHLISGSYFAGAAMKRSAMLRSYQQSNGYYACTCNNGATINHLSQATMQQTNPKQFTATFASLIELENNLNNQQQNGHSPSLAVGSGVNGGCRTSELGNYSMLNGSGSAGGGGCATGDILSSISDSSPTTSSSSSSSSSSGIEQARHLHNGYGLSSNGTSDITSHEHITRHIQRRQEEFERLMMNGSCCLNSNNYSHNRVANDYKYNNSFSSLGPINAPSGRTINDSYDDYSDCNDHYQQQNHRQTFANSNNLLKQQRHSTFDESSADNNIKLIDSVDDKSLTTTKTMRMPLLMSTNGSLLNSNNNNNNSCSLNNAYCSRSSITQSVGHNFIDKFTTSIAPSTVAQVGISRCAATCLYLFAAFLILFGLFIFVLEFVNVFGFL